jgi:hypothetical protein
MFLRLIAGAGLFAIGYYVGREVGRMDPIIEELKRARDARAPHAGIYDHEPTVETQDTRTEA